MSKLLFGAIPLMTTLTIPPNCRVEGLPALAHEVQEVLQHHPSLPENVTVTVQPADESDELHDAVLVCWSSTPDPLQPTAPQHERIGRLMTGIQEDCQLQIDALVEAHLEHD